MNSKTMMTMLGVMAEGKVNIGAPCLDGLQVLQQQTLILYPPGLTLRPLLSVFQLWLLPVVLEVIQDEIGIHTSQIVMDLRELATGHLTASDSYLKCIMS